MGFLRLLEDFCSLLILFAIFNFTLAGEVSLKMGGDKGDDPDSEYKKWGIEIRVSFREGVKAQVLSAQVQ